VLLPARIAQRGCGLLKPLLHLDGGLARGVGDVLVEKQIGDKEVVGDPRVERVGGGVGFVVADGGHFVFGKVCKFSSNLMLQPRFKNTPLRPNSFKRV
jgi:hypothetical protein